MPLLVAIVHLLLLQARDISVSDAIGASPPGSRNGSRSLSRAARGALPLDRHSSSTTASGELKAGLPRPHVGFATAAAPSQAGHCIVTSDCAGRVADSSKLSVHDSFTLTCWLVRLDAVGKLSA